MPKNAMQCTENHDQRSRSALSAHHPERMQVRRRRKEIDDQLDQEKARRVGIERTEHARSTAFKSWADASARCERQELNDRDQIRPRSGSWISVAGCNASSPDSPCIEDPQDRHDRGQPANIAPSASASTPPYAIAEIIGIAQRSTTINFADTRMRCVFVCVLFPPCLSSQPP